jgi:membrane-associated HD superfamily phosphohydrolase
MKLYHLWLLLELILLARYEYINRKAKELNIKPVVFYTLVSIPIVMITWIDLMYNGFRLESMGVPALWNKQIRYMLGLFGSYGMIQILAQDSGLKTGEIQRDTIQNSLLFSIIALGTAYSVTSNRSQAMIAVLYYFHLKYVISNNKTSPVCFEDV